MWDNKYGGVELFMFCFLSNPVIIHDVVSDLSHFNQKN